MRESPQVLVLFWCFLRAGSVSWMVSFRVSFQILVLCFASSAVGFCRSFGFVSLSVSFVGPVPGFVRGLFPSIGLVILACRL